MSKDSHKKSKGLKLTRKQLLGGAIVAVVLVVAIGAGLLVRRWQEVAQKDKRGAEITGLLDNPLPKDVTKAQDLGSQGKYDEANKVIDNSLPSAGDDTKYELYLQQGVNYEAQKQYDQAMDAYHKAEAIKKTFTIYKAIGRVLEAKGDKQAAIGSYRQAIDLIDQNDPLAGTEKTILEDKIKELGG